MNCARTCGEIPEERGDELWFAGLRDSIWRLKRWELRIAFEWRLVMQDDRHPCLSWFTEQTRRGARISWRKTGPQRVWHRSG
jgi:hypothetical protein